MNTRRSPGLMVVVGGSVSSAQAFARSAAAVLAGTVCIGFAVVAQPAATTVAPHQVAGIALGVGRLVPDATANDLQGKPHALSEFRPKAALVIALTSATCPISGKFGPELARLQRTYAERGVEMVFVNVAPADGAEAMEQQRRDLGLAGAYLVDSELGLCRALGATSTTEVFVLDAARTMVYRGAVSDQYGLGYSLEAPRRHYLREAIEAVIAGRAPLVQATTAPGCVLDLAAGKQSEPAASLPAQPVTYHNRISRIMQASCVECHRVGGVGPFGLDSYQAVVSRAGSIRAVIERGVMPPWFAAPIAPAAPTEAPRPASPGHTIAWVNDRTLPAADKADLLAWLSSDKPEGDKAQAAAPRQYPSIWQIGQPDAVIEIPAPQAVKAEGVMGYVHVRVPTEFAQDKWVQAVQVMPTARQVVHHVLVFVLPPVRPGENAQQVMREAIDETRGFFAAYVPGSEGQVFPEGFAKPLPAGSTLVFQIHYTPNGTATTDQTRLGLVFADRPPAHVVRVAGIANRRINIPPGEPAHKETATLRVERDSRVTAFMPHMHVRGAAFRYDATLPDGSSRVLLDVPRYDFNWQLRYVLAEPIELPKGTVLTATAVYDNSDANPANPDPGKRVKWGPQTTDEMMLGYVEYFQVGAEEQDADELHSGGPGTRLDRIFKMLDKNGDGKLQRDEVPQALLNLFDRLDADKDGVLTREEARRGR